MGHHRGVSVDASTNVVIVIIDFFFVVDRQFGFQLLCRL